MHTVIKRVFMSDFNIFSLDIRVKVKYIGHGQRLRSNSEVKVKVWVQVQLFGAECAKPGTRL